MQSDRGDDAQIRLTRIHAFGFSLATETKGSRIEVRIDSSTGEPVGELNAPPTGKKKDWLEKAMPVKPVSGEHNIYFVFKNRLTVIDLPEVKGGLFRKDIP